MPWKEVSTMSQRHEFMLLTQQPGVPSAPSVAGSRSPTTAYKWLARYATEGLAGLADHSRRPHQMPQRTPTALDPAVAHPAPHVGRPQAARPSPGPKLCHGAGPQHHHRDPPPRRVAPPRRGRPQAGVAALRAAHPQCLMTFQRPFPRGRRPVPPPDRAGRLLPLRPLSPRLSQ